MRSRARLTPPQAGFKTMGTAGFSEVIKSPSVQHLEFKGQSMVIRDTVWIEVLVKTVIRSRPLLQKAEDQVAFQND